MAMPLVDLATSSFILFAVIYARSLVFEDIRESPVEWDAFEETFACDISKNIPKSYKIHDYTRRAQKVTNAFRERTRIKHEGKRKYYESSERRFNNPSLRKTERVPKVIGRPGVFRDRNSV